MIYCVDFDDLCDASLHTLEHLEALRVKYPGFKATLFTIPNRTSDETIAKLRTRSWLSLAPHGWEHTKGECLSWSVEEAKDKIRAARDRGVDAPVFRAPAWLISAPIYQACSELGYTIASHREFHLPSDSLHPEEYPYAHVPQYIYNMPNGRAPKVRGVHGHLTPVCDNAIADMIADNRLSFATKAEFVWPWDVAVQVRSTSEEVE